MKESGYQTIKTKAKKNKNKKMDTKADTGRRNPLSSRERHRGVWRTPHPTTWARKGGLRPTWPRNDHWWTGTSWRTNSTGILWSPARRRRWCPCRGRGRHPSCPRDPMDSASGKGMVVGHGRGFWFSRSPCLLLSEMRLFLGILYLHFFVSQSLE